MTRHSYTAPLILLALFFSLAAFPALAESDPPVKEHPSRHARSAATAPTACPDPASIPRTVAPADKVALPILMYHHITVLSANASATWRNLTVTPAAFEDQVTYLADHGYHTIYFSDLVAYFHEGVPLPEKPIILTFDDGWTDHYTVAYPILAKHCMVGVFFAPVNWVNNGGGKQVMSWAMIEEMSKGGMEFGSHTLNHHLLNQQTEKQIMVQLVDSKAELEKHTVRPVVALAYPGGGYNTLAVSLVPKAGYGAAVGVTAGPDQARADRYLLHRIAVPYSDNLKMFEVRIKSKLPANAGVTPGQGAARSLSPGSMNWPDRWEDLIGR
jgi:peptidoglycan/xylan/chitin deacetylase (PgdA/CDA1 family)